MAKNSFVKTIAFTILASLLLLAFNITAKAQLNRNHFINKAQFHISEGEYTYAIRSLNVIINVDSTIAIAWFLRGVAKYNLNDLHGAHNDLTHAIKQNPVFSIAYLYRGIVYSRMSRYSQAMVDLNMTIDLRPGSPDGYYSRGISLLLMQEFDKSIDDFNRVIQLQPRNTDAWINRGSAKLFKTDTIGAIADYSRAINIDPSYSESYSKRGRTYFELNQFQHAIDDLNRAIELDSSSSINLFTRAISYSKLGSTDKALNDINRAIKISPSNALSIYNRALLHWKNGDFNLALSDFHKASSLSPENVLIYYNRGILNLEMKRLQDAMEDFTQAIHIFPDFANAYLARSTAHAQAGRMQESLIDRQRGHAIAEKLSQDDTNILTDSTSNMQNLIAFNSDFTPITSIPFLNEFDSRSVDILPMLRFVPVSTIKTEVFSQQFDALDTLNAKLKKHNVGLKITTESSQIDIDSISVDDEFLMVLFQGIKLSENKHYNQSVDYYKKSLEVSRNNPIALLNCATELANMVTFIASFEQEIGAVSLNQHQRSSSNTPSANLSLESFVESLEILEKLNLTTPNLYAVKYNFGNIYALSGHFETAKAYYTKAIELNPYLAQGWYNRALIHLMQKDNINGCIDISKAGELGMYQAYSILNRFCKN